MSILTGQGQIKKGFFDLMWNLGLINNSSEPSFGIGRKKKIKMRAIKHHLLSGKVVDDKYSTDDSIIVKSP